MILLYTKYIKYAIAIMWGIFIGGAVADAWPFKDGLVAVFFTVTTLLISKLFSFVYGKPRSKFLNTWWKKAIVYLILFVISFLLGLTF